MNKLQQVLPAFTYQWRQNLYYYVTQMRFIRYDLKLAIFFFVMSKNNFLVLTELIYTLFSNHYKNQSLCYSSV